MTKLEAVNRVLRAISEPPATALDTGGTTDVADAETFLDDSTATVLAERRWWTATVTKTYTPAVLTGKIDMTGVRKWELTENSQDLDLTVRDGFLYDLENDTDVFTATVELKVTEVIDFDELPISIQEYILAHARMQFAGYKKRGQMDVAVLSNELISYRTRAIQEDNDHNEINLLNTTDALNIKGRRNKYVI